ncbi:gamma-aminobutyric acid type B receptor subunit 2-like isoform X2 [Glandiceps talaboti]
MFRPNRNSIMPWSWQTCVALCVTFGMCTMATVGADNGTTDVSRDLYFAALFPFTSEGPEREIALGVKPAIDLAIQHINNKSHILTGYRLNMESYDTKCNMAVGTRAFFDAMATGPLKMMVFGSVCSKVTAPIAEAVLWWKQIQLSYANTEPFLSEREKYPTFFRTVPSEADLNPAKLKLLEFFNWTHVATIHQDTPRFSIAHNKLSSDLESIGKQLMRVESFATDPKNAVQGIKESGARIILGFFDEIMARKVFCYAYKNKVFGSRYVWIIPGWYSEKWWMNVDFETECSIEEILESIQGYLATERLSLGPQNMDTISGLTPLEYENQYRDACGHNYHSLHGYAYDGVWVIASAIDKVLHHLNQNASNILNTRMGNKYIFNLLMEAMNETDFVGVTGPIKFRGGDRLGTIVLEQYQNGEEVMVGEYHAYNDEFVITNTIVWEGGSAPIDRPIIFRYPSGVSFILYVTLGSLSYLGIMIALMFLFFNMKFRKHRYIKMSSPFLNNLIIIGGILCYGSIYFLGLDGTYFTDHEFEIICTIKSWMIAVGFTVAFGAMFSKTWRVYSIFTNIKMKKKVIRDYRLFGIVGVLLLVDVIILVAWVLKDPLKRKIVEGAEQPDPGGKDISIIPITHHCQSVHMSIWLAAIYIYKGVLMIFGCFLAWETRHVTIPALNDSKYIGMSVYNVVVMCTIGAALSFVIHDNPNASFGIMSLFLLFSTTITLCLVFVPKLLELRRDPKGEERKIRCTPSKASLRIPPSSSSTDLSTKMRGLTSERSKLNKVLQERDKQMSYLLEKLGMKHTRNTDSTYSVSTNINTPLPSIDDTGIGIKTAEKNSPPEQLSDFQGIYIPVTTVLNNSTCDDMNSGGDKDGMNHTEPCEITTKLLADHDNPNNGNETSPSHLKITVCDTDHLVLIPATSHLETHY